MEKLTNRARRRGQPDRFARRLVQLGFLLLSLYPFVPLIFRRLTSHSAPTFTSWLLPWDPLLLAGQLAHGHWETLVIGAPLLLIAATIILGRAFCGWICPLGALLDFIQPIVFRRKQKKQQPLTRLFRADANSPIRYFILVFVLAGGALSLQALGLLDPLVVFLRAATTLYFDTFAIQQSALRVPLAVISLILLGIVALEFWQRLFWCRNLCPLGALLSVFSRWSVLNRRVSSACSACEHCRDVCSMNAIDLDPVKTDYAHCRFCFECESACPRDGITFGFGQPAVKRRRPEKKRTAPDCQPALAANFSLKMGKTRFTRRDFIGGLTAAAAGIGFTPAVQMIGEVRVIRPPGALPEKDFLRTCILCQECIRVCPTGGLRSSFLEAGLSGIGMPRLAPRQGGCVIEPSCPNLCAQVCPVGAIRRIPPKQCKIGLAKVERSLCLAWDQGVKCLVCIEACMVGAAKAYHGQVIVDPEKCTGCGRCENACPIVGSAIRVYPLP